MSFLSLKDICKVYPGGVQAVSNVSLDAEEGECIVLVGPSGCGKSTLLRMIAGLESISAGELRLKGKRINDLAPAERDVAMVFQDYALYGNMTVYRNIGFSLTIRGEDDDTIHQRVMDVSRTVGLFDYLNRYPKALSGGQKQRVAMGRSLAKQAALLLMDEPLSNLDAKLRLETRRELAQLHNALKTTVVYVTHDQTEAMTLADRIVVLCDGVVQQIGRPGEIYRDPANLFTAGFIGMPPINLLKGTFHDGAFVALGSGGEAAFKAALGPAEKAALAGKAGQTLVLGLRPEQIRAGGSGAAGAALCRVGGTILHTEFLGPEYSITADAGGCAIGCRMSADEHAARGQRLELRFSMGDALFFDAASGARIRIPAAAGREAA
ncbi:MAG: ABC transporter ATP-binding protein [Treponema sp.]|jgi:multiple sugar transport system ATP-binding protein|nr:ABC transporter ATP-binding protein [Treponema sp.]